MAHDVFVDADDSDVVEPGRVVDQGPLAFGQDGVVGGVPGDPESFGDAGDGEVLNDDALQSPAQPAARQLRSGFGGAGGVLAPHVGAAGAGVAADRHDQRRWSPTERLVGQAAGHGVAGDAFAAAASTPPFVGISVLDDAAGEHGPLRFEALAGYDEAELVEAAEGGQIGGVEPCIRARRDGSVVHVEVFQVEGVGTSILGRPRPLSAHRRAENEVASHTLNCEEPGTLQAWNSLNK